MKTNTIGIGTTIEEKEIMDLAKEIKETVAKDFIKKNGSKSTFGIIDLWSLQKKHKSLGSSTKW